MVIQPLDSADNKTVRLVKRLGASHQTRGKNEETLIEGPHLIEEALSAGYSPRLVVYSPKWVARAEGRSLLIRLQTLSAQLFYVTDRLFDELSPVETPQGILAVIPTPKSIALSEVLEEPALPLLLPIALGVQDPGNLGTLIRAALAAGAPAFGVAPGTVEPFNPKCIRASAGALLRLPLVMLEPDWPAQLAAHGVHLYATAVNSGKPYFEADWTEPSAVLFGNEGSGLSEEWLSQSEVVTIPMSPISESLNVSVAGAVLLFHASYQRLKAGIGFLPTSML